MPPTIKSKSRKLPLRDRRAIRDRLVDLVKTHFVNRAQFQHELHLPQSTVAQWFGRDPTTPEGPALVRIAKHAKRINLNWLLLGEEAEIRGQSRSTANLWSEVRNTVVAEVVRAGASQEDADAYVPDAMALSKALFTPIVANWKQHDEARKRSMRRGIAGLLGRAIDGDLTPYERLALSLQNKP